MTSRSIVGRNDFPDYDMLDAMISSALKRLLDKHVRFRKRVRMGPNSTSSKRCAFRCHPGRIVQLQTVLVLYDQETIRNNGQTSYLRLKTY